MSTRQRKIPRSTRFEDALAELEEIVRQLESGEESLETSLARFERGVSLSRFCQESLAEAEQKVQVLLEENGEERLANINANGTARNASAEKTARGVSDRTPETDNSEDGDNF